MQGVFKEFYDFISSIDLIYLIITILSLVKCYKKGFVLSILSMAKWLLAYVLTLIIFPLVKPYFKGVIDNQYVLDIGLGITILETAFGKIGVANVMTNLFMPKSNPVFEVLNKIKLKFNSNENLCFSLVDVHGEATSEKLAIGHLLDGHVSAVVGTHTHIPTSDYRVLENGTAYITDVGMSGDYNSVIGMEKKAAISRFQNPNNKHPRLTVADGPPTLCGVIINSKKNGLAESIKPIRIGGVIDNIGI